jgi:hypothetical protein
MRPPRVRSRELQSDAARDPGGVHHIEGGEIDAADGAAPATDAAIRLREEPEITCVDAEIRLQGAKGRAKNPPFCFMPRRALAGAATTAYLDKAQVSAR